MNYETMTNTELVNEIKLLKSSLEEAERRLIEYKLAEHDKRLQKLTELSITLSGEPIDIFKRVAEMIGELLDIPIVCLSEIQGDELHFLSVYNKGEILTNAGHCPISITPCSTVKDSKDMRIYQNVIEKFPKASFLKTHNAFSYCGFPSIDSEGNVISVACLLDDKQHEYSDEDKGLLQIFAQRIGTEMERKKHKAERKQAEDAINMLVISAAENEGQKFFEQTVSSLYDWLSVDCVAIGQLIDEVNIKALAMKKDGGFVDDFSYELKGSPCAEVSKKGYCFYPEGVIDLFPDDKALVQFNAEGYVGIPLKNKRGDFIGVISALSRHKLELPSGAENVFEIIAARASVELERIRAEEELLIKERQYRKIFESSQDALVIFNFNGVIKEANPAACEMYGYLYEEMIGLYGKDIVHPDYHYLFEMFVEKATSGEVFSTESVNIHKNGPLFNTDVRGSSYEYRGEPHILAIVRDITERKKMEEALLQSEKLKSIGTITAGISHEFNNLLAIISGNVQLLENTYKDHGELTEALCIIKRATDDGAGISGKMLEFTKTVPDTKKFVSSDIRDLIRQSIDFTMPRWKNEAQAKGTNYKIDTEGMKSVSSIMCNPTELREVFINIMINAFDAMPEGGSLSFSTWRGDDTVFVGISDTGEGMSEEVRKNIFDPFFTTKTPVGTGLGMSMAYGIISRHGGKIEVESELGKGTIFSLQFPIAAKVGNTELCSEPAQDIQCKSLHILVVDDEVNIGKLLDKFLSGDGHKVKTVDNGADAIELMKKEEFDLVLCDLAMPDVSGYDVIKALNKFDRRPRIGIITGWGKKLKPIEEGMNVDFVVRKPFDFSELSRKINDVIGVG